MDFSTKRRRCQVNLKSTPLFHSLLKKARICDILIKISRKEPNSMEGTSQNTPEKGKKRAKKGGALLHPCPTAAR